MLTTRVSMLTFKGKELPCSMNLSIEAIKELIAKGIVVWFNQISYYYVNDADTLLIRPSHHKHIPQGYTL